MAVRCGPGFASRAARRPGRPDAPRHALIAAIAVRKAAHSALAKVSDDIEKLRFNRCIAHIYEFANAGNHLHLLIRAKCRFALQDFLRAFAGVVARLITGARKGRPIGKFWDFLAYSRVVTWGRDFFGVRAYIVQNELGNDRAHPHAHRGRIRKQSPAVGISAILRPTAKWKR
jgi:hypothetical protein